MRFRCCKPLVAQEPSRTLPQYSCMSNRPHIERPDQPIRVSPFRLTLDDERLAADGELIARTRVRNLARPQLEPGCLGMDAGPPEAEDGIGAPGHHRTETGSPTDRRVEASIPNAANVASTAPLNTVIRCACP
jgi:hypothetical protein